MACKVVRPDIWAGKGMLFLRAAQAVVHTQTALPTLTAEDTRRLKEVSDLFYRAAFWERWLVDQDFRATPVPEFAQQAHELVSVVADAVPMSRFMHRVRRAVNTLNAAIVGQRPDARAVAECANLCRQFGEHLTVRQSRTADDD